MEDAVTRQHAQYLVAASVAVGGRVLGALLQRQRSGPHALELLAPGTPHSPLTAARLQLAARNAVRASLREPPLAVFAQPIDGGYRVRALLSPQRAPLQPYELTDIQMAWTRARERTLGYARVPGVAARECDARAQEVSRALADLLAVQRRVMHGQPELQVDLADAINRAQMAMDAWRDAQQRARPLEPRRRVQVDTLTFAVRTEGLEGLPLVEHDRALRTVMARAVGLADPGELRVTTRPTRTPGEAVVRVSFNLRHSAARGPEHLDPGSLRDTILTWAAQVPATPVRIGATVAQVSVRAIECLSGLTSPEVPQGAVRDLPLPAPVRAATPERVRNIAL
jgi:hypothetical protein